MKKLWAAAAALLLASTIGYRLKPASLPAPDVVFTTITGKSIALTDLRGKPVIVTFWATDCSACIKEIPDWLELYRQFHPRGLEMIAVAMYYDPPSRVVAMANGKALPYHVALDVSASHARAFGGVELTPTTFLISPKGLIIDHETGAIDPVQWKIHLQTLLKG